MMNPVNFNIFKFSGQLSIIDFQFNFLIQG